MKVKKFKIVIKSADEPAGEHFSKRMKNLWTAAEANALDRIEHNLVITLPDISWLSKIFSHERLRLIKAIRDTKPESIYQLAKILGRSQQNVRKDVHELAEFGIITLKKVRKKGQKMEAIHPEYNWDGFDIAV